MIVDVDRLDSDRQIRPVNGLQEMAIAKEPCRPQIRVGVLIAHRRVDLAFPTDRNADWGDIAVGAVIAVEAGVSAVDIDDPGVPDSGDRRFVGAGIAGPLENRDGFVADQFDPIHRSLNLQVQIVGFHVEGAGKRIAFVEFRTGRVGLVRRRFSRQTRSNGFVVLAFEVSQSQ